MSAIARLLRSIAVAVLCTAWLTAEFASAQPGDRAQPDAERPSGRGSAERSEETRRLVRERLTKRIEINEREGRDLAVALHAIDSDKSLSELRRESPQVRRLMEQIEREDFRDVDGLRGPRAGVGLEGRDVPGPGDMERRRAGAGPRMGGGAGGGVGGGGERVAHLMSVMRTFDDLDELIRVSASEMPRTDAADVKPLSDSERLAMHEYLAAAAPDLDQQLRQLRERDAEAANERYQRIMPRMTRVIELKSSDPEMFSMVVEGAQLRRQSGEASRWIVRHESDPALQDKVAERRAELRGLAARVLTLSERVAVRLADRRVEMREEITDRITTMMIERERHRIEREQSGGEGGGPPPGPGGERRPGRPRGERPGPPDPNGRP